MPNVNAPKPTPAPKPGQQQARIAARGDEVFFHRRGTPVSGKVLCAGQHGCTVEHGGKQHKVKWEHINGHKKRAVQRYKVVEKGEDGLIVEDDGGQRRFVGIPPEARGEQLKLK